VEWGKVNKKSKKPAQKSTGDRLFRTNGEELVVLVQEGNGDGEIRNHVEKYVVQKRINR